MEPFLIAINDVDKSPVDAAKTVGAVDEPSTTSVASKMIRLLAENKQLVAIIVSVILGLLIGILAHGAVQESAETEKVVMYIKFPGELFLRMLRMIIIPLTVTSIVVALAEVDTSTAGKLGQRTFLYYAVTTMFAVALGIFLVKTIRPGEGSGMVGDDTETTTQVTTLDSFLDLLRNMVPPNLVAVAMKSTQTQYSNRQYNFRRQNKTIPASAEGVANFLKENTVVQWSADGKNITIIVNEKTSVFSGTFENNATNYIGLMMFSVLLGIILRKLGKDGRPLLDFCRAWLHVVMLLVSWIMWFSPVGILSLIAGSLVDVSDIKEAFQDIGMYVVVLSTGCFIQTFIFYPSLYFLVVRKNPFKYLSGMVPAMVTAFGTSSSAVTLPVTIRSVIENNDVDRRVAQFCLPIGATCNMDGSALGLAVFTIFMANIQNISMSFGQVIMTALVAIFISVGSSGIPSSGPTYILMILEAVGIPTTFIGLIYAVDWITDRIITTNNVMGDAFGAGIVNHLTKMNDEERELGSNETVEEKPKNNFQSPV